MNDSNRNIRTLISCFVLAVMVLIPLRFIEEGQSAVMDQPQVLGEEVVLPNSEVTEVPTCISKDDADILLEKEKGLIRQGNLTGLEIDAVVNRLIDIEKNTCK
jgi:hypothetical protein